MAAPRLLGASAALRMARYAAKTKEAMCLDRCGCEWKVTLPTSANSVFGSLAKMMHAFE